MERRFVLAVKAVIRDDQGRVLALLRSREALHFGGTWDLPGGKVNRGEDLDAALIRETLEETQLDVRVDGLAGATEYDMETLRVILIFLHATVLSGDVHVHEGEHDAARWVPGGELATLDWSPQIRPFAEQYLVGRR